MGSDPLDIARAMVALPGWRWLPGMRWRLTATAGGHDLGRLAGRVLDDGYLLTDSGSTVHHDGGCLPDLTDPATLGAVEYGLLAPAGVRVYGIRGALRAQSGQAYVAAWRTTLAEALLDGLRAVTP